MYVQRYKSSLGTSFEMSIKSIPLSRYEKRVPEADKYVVFNPGDNTSYQRLSGNHNYISTMAKKIDEHRTNKYQNVKEFIRDKITVSWREGNY